MLSHVFGVLALSLCSALPSFNSSLVSPPKRAITDVSQVYGSYEFEFELHHDDYFDFGWDNPFMVVNHQQVDIDGSWHACNGNTSDYGFDVRGKIENGAITLNCNMTFYVNDTSLKTQIVSLISSSLNGSPYQDWYYQGPGATSYGIDLNLWRSVPLGDATYSISFDLEPSAVASYSVTANYLNCSHTAQSGENYLPASSYTSSTRNNPYFFRVDASSGCRFRKDGSAVSTTGGITINSILYDGLPASVGSDYATWIAIELNLPLSDCSITFNAINQFAVNKNLDACTTTIPDVYSVGMTGTYRIEALSGYAFDSNLTQYTITGIVVNSVAYADNIYGHLYRTIVLDLTFPATNYANVTATASPYSADYAQGFRDGESSGLELKGGLMDLIPNVFASIGAFFFTFSGVNFMGINLLAIVGIVVSVGLIGVVIKVALK